MIELIERPFPDANTVIVPGDRPLVVDSGFIANASQTEELLLARDILDEHTLLVNTHWHSDHIGANGLLSDRYGMRIAAHALEAAQINVAETDLSASRFLDQPVPTYSVSEPLADGQLLSTGAAEVVVVHTPGHTRGHIALFEEASRTIIGGDIVQLRDFGWINVVHDGFEAVHQAIASVDRLIALEPVLILPGHGAAITDPLSVLSNARKRYESFLIESERLAWHACKRILAYAVIIHQPMTVSELTRYATESQWLDGFASQIFRQEIPEIANRLIAGLMDSGGLLLREDGTVACRVVTTAPNPGS